MEVVGAIISNNDVAFYWSMLCTGAGDKEKDELLSRIVDLWVTIRGFSFERSWMEMFKQTNKCAKNTACKSFMKRFTYYCRTY